MIVVFHHCGLYIISNMEFLFLLGNQLFVSPNSKIHLSNQCYTNLSKSSHKSIIPILGNSRRILYQERGGSPCVSGIEHKSRIICHLTDASDTSDAKSSDTQMMIMGGAMEEEDGA